MDSGVRRAGKRKPRLPVRQAGRVPFGAPSAWLFLARLRPRRAWLRFTKQDHCTSGPAARRRNPRKASCPNVVNGVYGSKENWSSLTRPQVVQFNPPGESPGRVFSLGVICRSCGWIRNIVDSGVLRGRFVGHILIWQGDRPVGLRARSAREWMEHICIWESRP